MPLTLEDRMRRYWDVLRSMTEALAREEEVCDRPCFKVADSAQEIAAEVGKNLTPEEVQDLALTLTQWGSQVYACAHFDGMMLTMKTTPPREVSA